MQNLQSICRVTQLSCSTYLRYVLTYIRTHTYSYTFLGRLADIAFRSSGESWLQSHIVRILEISRVSGVSQWLSILT